MRFWIKKKQSVMKNDILNGIKNIVFDFGCVLVDLDRHKCIEARNAIGAHKMSR